MLDYMEWCLWRYYSQIHWSESSFYSSLNALSHPLLSFPTPAGASMTLGKAISPNLKGSYTLGLPNTRNVGFLFTSVPLALPTLHLKDEHEIQQVRVVDRIRPARPTPPSPPDTGEEGSAAPSGSPYLLYGRLFEDGRLESLYMRLLHPRLLLVNSGVSSWRPNGSYLSSSLMYNSPRWCGELTYTTDDHVLGLSGLCHLLKTPESSWSVGSELYYTLKEKSGGVSLAARYTTLHSNLPESAPHLSTPDAALTPDPVPPPATPPTTSCAAAVTLPRASSPPFCPYSDLLLTVNPMMGHLSSTYTTTVTPRLTACTKYEFNVYSFESDVSCGFDFHSRGQDPPGPPATLAPSPAPVPPGGPPRAAGPGHAPGPPIFLDGVALGRQDARVGLDAPGPRNEVTQILKGRVSLASGMALKFESAYRQFSFSLGIETEFARFPRRWLGLELHV